MQSKRRKGAFLFLSFVLFLAFGCARSLPEDSEVPFKGTTFSFDQGTYPSATGLFEEYYIQPGDELDVLFQIKTWEIKEDFKIEVGYTVSVKFVNLPELNEEQMVLPNGCIALPYLGEVKVIGKTVKELTAELKNKYVKILRDPEIYVTVPEYLSRIKELKRDLHTAPRGLSRLVTVRPDGCATFPMIGDYFVVKKTISQVDALLDKEYERYLPGLHADLFLHKTKGAVLNIAGEVEKPGIYRTKKPITVLEALTKAGGATSDAKLENVIVFRKHERKIIARRLNLKDVLALKPSSTFFYLKADDFVYVPKRKLASLAESMSLLADVLMFRGWYAGYSISENVEWIHHD
ncbi:MAG: hypothetical protein B5M53_09530 [Candidatus Cloacimonas sp. 4484_209]|nr:MAG: hypothetical protein B5M53_09530 [Candidatus Cloacimonas sp. 4484_209]